METSYLLERKIISICFNPLKESVFILSYDGEAMQLVEEDLSKSVILKQYKLLRFSECNITNLNFRKTPKETFEGYGIYFWELTKKLIVHYPGGYLMFYDYQSTQLISHFQCQGKKAYVIRNIVGSPLQRSLFISAESMRNIYNINFDNIKNNITYNKLVIPEKETVYDLVCHPNEKFIFAGCSDSIIRIFNYSNENAIVEIKTGLVDVPLGKDGKPQKNQADLIKKSGINSVVTMDFNNTGTYLLSGNENGWLYLWDSMQAIKGKRTLLAKEKYSPLGVIYSIKFIKSRQYDNMNRFICITKEGKFHILNVISKDENGIKTHILNRLCENSIFNPIPYSINKYNVITSNLISVSNFSNIISVKWPVMRVEKLKSSNSDKTEDYLMFINFNAKFFFIYDNIFPKINFALSSQTSYREYEDYIPVSNSNNLIFERRVFSIDNFFILCYDIMTGQNKKLLNYSNKFNLKSIFPLKFEMRMLYKNEGDLNEISNEFLFLILIENENYQKSVLLVIYDIQTETVKLHRKFEDVIDYAILDGNTYELNKHQKIKHIFMLNKLKQVADIFNLESNTVEKKPIEGTILRVYSTPFNNGYTVLYRNILNELKYSANYRSNDLFDFKCSDSTLLRLDYSEREVDVIWKKIEGQRFICAISMIEKIIITDENFRILYSLKFNLLENPNIISSLFFISETLFYNRGCNILYFNGEDNLNQRIFSTDQPNSIITAVLADRYVLAAKLLNSKDINNVSVTTPMINPLEPTLIGYLNKSNVDYNLIKEAVTNLYTNQFSQNLIDKLLKKDLKEVAWLLVNDNKSSYQNTKTKVSLLNDLLKFDSILDTLFHNKNLKNDMDLDEIIWRVNYDNSMEKIKNILSYECAILINYGQFDTAMKILEILGDYQKIINLALLTLSKEEYQKISNWFQTKNSLSYSDSVFSRNIFFVTESKNETLNNGSIKDADKKKQYSKIFDTYEGEHFIVGANQEKYNIKSVKEAPLKIAKKNSNINNINKKILSFGETAFDQFVEIFNNETVKMELSNICRLVVQKIDQYYGYKNTVYENTTMVQGKKRNDFTDFSVPLSEIKSDNINGDAEEENSLDENIEEISEAIYLTAYYHCDKGSGTAIEDISDNGNEATISYNSMMLSSSQAQENDEYGNGNSEDRVLWSAVLEEFEPLEYEDKWGRKSPGSHAIKFSKKFNTSMKIKNTKNFIHMAKKFTIELWTKINSIDNTIFVKDSLCLEIQNNNFCLKYLNKLITYTKTSEYNISFDTWAHLAVTYKKKSGKMILYFNCEPILNFSLNLSEDIGIKGDLVFGNGNFDGEVTEIRIWKEELPQKFIRENYKSPLPILADNKKKIRMKINKQEKDKKLEVGRNPGTNRFQSFAFGKNNPLVNSTTLSNFSNPQSNAPANKFKSFYNPAAVENPYKAINLNNPIPNSMSNPNNNNLTNNTINLPNESALDIQSPIPSYSNIDSKARNASPSPISLNPNQTLHNTNFNNAQNSPGHNIAEFDPYKSINLQSAGNLNNAFNNSNNININNNFNEGFNGEIINNTMNLNISEIKPMHEVESGNYPEFHQLNRDSIASVSNPEAINPSGNGGLDFNNAGNENNFEANFNDFNNAQSFNNQMINNNFPDKEEFDF